MRSTCFSGAALLGLAAALPAPQDLEFEAIRAMPDPTIVTVTAVGTATADFVTYDTSAILSSALPLITSIVADNGASTTSTIQPPVTTTEALRKRAACQTQPAGAKNIATFGAQSPSDFAANTYYQGLATAAPTSIAGFTRTFVNLKGANNAYGYMGYQNVDSYDVAACAAKCNKMAGCASFNIYIERDPSLEPADACPNPDPVVYVKCSYWGGPVNEANALNKGQWRNKFQVLITASNGYQSDSIKIPSGYTLKDVARTAAINAPLDIYGYDTYMGFALFNTGPFNVKLCADACTLKNDYAYSHPPTDGTPIQACSFFDTYILYINNTNKPQGQYCAMYSQTWDSSYLKNTGYYYGSDRYILDYSYTFFNTTSPGAPNKNAAVRVASKVISNSGLGQYCTSLLGITTPSTTVTTILNTVSTTVVTARSTATSIICTRRPVMKRDDLNSTATTEADALPTSDAELPDAFSPGASDNAEGVANFEGGAVFATLPLLTASGATPAATPSTSVATSTASPSAADATPASIVKRIAAAPAATPTPLTRFPGEIITSACSLNATTPATVTSTSTITVFTSTYTATAYTRTVVATTLRRSCFRMQYATGDFTDKYLAVGDVRQAVYDQRSGSYVVNKNYSPWYYGSYRGTTFAVTFTLLADGQLYDVTNGKIVGYLAPGSEKLGSYVRVDGDTVQTCTINSATGYIDCAPARGQMCTTYVYDTDGYKYPFWSNAKAGWTCDDIQDADPVAIKTVAV